MYSSNSTKCECHLIRSNWSIIMWCNVSWCHYTRLEAATRNRLHDPTLMLIWLLWYQILNLRLCSQGWIMKAYVSLETTIEPHDSVYHLGLLPLLQGRPGKSLYHLTTVVCSTTKTTVTAIAENQCRSKRMYNTQLLHTVIQNNLFCSFIFKTYLGYLKQ